VLADQASDEFYAAQWGNAHAALYQPREKRAASLWTEYSGGFGESPGFLAVIPRGDDAADEPLEQRDVGETLQQNDHPASVACAALRVASGHLVEVVYLVSIEFQIISAEIKVRQVSLAFALVVDLPFPHIDDPECLGVYGLPIDVRTGDCCACLEVGKYGVHARLK
jgi:hypothetical protein